MADTSHSIKFKHFFVFFSGFLLVLLTVFALLSEINDCLEYGLPTLTVWTVSLGFSVFSVLVFSSKKAAIASICVFLAVIIWLALFRKISATEIIVSGISTFWTTFMGIIGSMGYVTLESRPLGSYFENPLTVLITFGFALSVLIALSVRKRIRYIPFIVVILTVTIPFLVFSLPSKSGYFLLLCSIVTALTAAKLTERNGANAFESNICGIFALVAALIIAFPATTVRKRADDIPLISDIVEYVRNELSAVLAGNYGENRISAKVGQPRSAAPEERNYSDKRILTVTSPCKYPVYLTDWVGTIYSDGKWYADSEMPYDFFTDTDILKNLIKESKAVWDKESSKLFGIIEDVPITVKYAERSNSVLLPFLTSAIEITSPRKADTYFVAEGVLRSDLKIKSFTATVNLQNGNSVLYNERIQAAAYLVSLAETGSYPSYDSVAGHDGNIVPQSAYSAAQAISDAFFRTYGRNISHSTFDAGLVAEMIGDYLAQTCEYSLDTLEVQYGDPIDWFLTESNKGYCVQFASAAALIFRVLGYKTRYVEGYVATDFVKSGSVYTCDVLDRNAHAWIEVWLPEYGWRLYEFTPGMTKYSEPITDEPEISVPSSKTDTEPETSRYPITDDAETSTETTHTQSPVTTHKSAPKPEKGLSPLAVAAICLLSVAVVAVLLVGRFNRKRQSTNAFLNGILKEKIHTDVKTQETLISVLADALAAYGINPDNRLPSEYGKRLSDRIGDIFPGCKTVLSALESVLYGESVCTSDTVILAKICVVLKSNAKKKLSKPKYFIERFILCRI